MEAFPYLQDSQQVHQWYFGEGPDPLPSAAPSHHWRILNHLRLLGTKCGLHPPDMPRKVAMPRSDPKASNDVLRVAVTENPSDKDHRLLSGPLGLVLDCQLSDFSDCSGLIFVSL